MASPRIVVIGAGPAGTRAAEALLGVGLHPVVVDEAPRSGGQIYRRPPPGFRRPARRLYGFETARARSLHEAFDRLVPRLDYRPCTLVWNLTGEGLHTVSAQGGEHATVPFDGLIIAPGATDRVIPFPGWTLPGVYTLGGAQVSLKYQACAIGRRPVFAGTGPLLYLVAWQYLRAGVRPLAVIDTAPLASKLGALAGLLARPDQLAKGALYLAELRARAVTVHQGARLVRAEGDEGVQSVICRDAGGRERRFEVDAVAFGYHLQAETQLADLAGCEFDFESETRQWLPRTDPDGRSTRRDVYLAGDGARVAGADVAEAAGALAALALARDRGLAVPEGRLVVLRRRLERGRRFARALARAFPVPHEALEALEDATVVCRCEEITAGDLRRTAVLGADEVNRAKAWSRLGMGRCQGRFCGLSAATLLAVRAGVPVAAMSRLRGQPPVKPVPVLPEAAG